jgi:hypothetical protein
MKPDYTHYECDEKLERFWVSIMIIPDIGQFITFCGDKAKRQGLLTRSTAIYKNSWSTRERRECSLELTSARVSNQRAFQFKANSSEKTDEDSLRKGGLTYY